MKHIYKLYTEFRPNLGEIVSSLFDGFTMYNCGGYYKGQCEVSTVIEIICDEPCPATIEALAGIIIRCNNQETVLITHCEAEVNVIVRREDKVYERTN